MGEEEEDTTVARRSRAPLPRGQIQPYLLVMSGDSLGRAFRIEGKQMVIGRGDDADIRLDDDGVSRHHAKIVHLAEGVVMVKDLDSTNGTYVNEKRIDAHPLQQGDRIRIGASASLKYSLDDQLEARLREHLFAAATKDPLTGLANRRFFRDELERALAFCRRHGQPLSLVSVDLDHFKRINDRYGHVTGDHVLKEVASRLQASLRAEDWLARVGGEEFAIVLSGIDLPRAIHAADRLRRRVGDGAIVSANQRLWITASLGVAEYNPHRHSELDSLLQEADARLYEAKQAGRNQVSPVGT